MLLSGERLHGIERSLTELKALRRQVQGILRDGDGRLVKTPARQWAGLLELLGELPVTLKSNSRSPKTGFSRS